MDQDLEEALTDLRDYKLTIQEKLVSISNRGPSFDLIRIAAVTIVLLHHARIVEYADIRVDPLFHYSGGGIHFGLFAVFVFFAVSGFLVTPSLLWSKNVIDFTSRRCLRIFPALIVVVIATMTILGPALTTLSPSDYFFNSNLYRYAKNILTLTYDYLPGVVDRNGHPIIVNGALWTLHFEVLSYGTLALTSLLGLLRRRSLFLVFFLVSYGMNLALNLDPSLLVELPQRFLTFIKLFVYFGAGATFFLFADRIPFSKAMAVSACALIMIAWPFGLGSLVLPLCLPYIIIFCGLSVLPGQPILKHDLSYGVYLIHAPILATVSWFFPGLRNWWLVAAIVFLITLGLSYLSWTFVEGPALRQKKRVSIWLNSRFDLFCALRNKNKNAGVA